MDIQLSLTAETVAAADPAEPVCVAPGLPLRQVLAILRQQGYSAALVCRAGTLEGIFTERDALHALAQKTPLDTPIEQLMTAAPATVRANASMASALHKMVAGGYRRLPVVDQQDHPIGVLQTSGIIHFLVEHFPRTIYNLPPVPHAATQEREGS